MWEFSLVEERHMFSKETKEDNNLYIIVSLYLEYT